MKFKSRNKFKMLLWVAFYLFAFSLLLSHSFNYLDPDFGWHIKAGEQTMQTKQVPHDQIYMWTLEGKDWVDHEWLSNIMLYLGYEHLGYFWLNIIFALIIILALSLATAYLKKTYFKNTGDYVLIGLQLLGLIAIMPHLGVRLQEITILFLVILLIIIDKFSRKPGKIIYWLIPLFLIWANLHAGFLIGIAVLGWWLTVQLILTIFKSKPTKWLKLLIIMVLSCAATLITPYGWKLYSFLSDYTNNAYLKIIEEWLPIYALPIHYWQMLFIAIIISLIIACYGLSLKKLNLWQVSITIIFLAMAIKSTRHFPLFFIVIYLCLIPDIIQKQMPDKFKQIINHNIIKIISIISLLLLSILVFFYTNFTNQPNLAFCDKYPCKAVEFLQNNPEYQKLKMYNRYNFGGFLIWAMPELPLFIDGRMPQYEFANHSLIQEYISFINDNIENKLKEYGIEMVLWNAKPNKMRLNWIDKYLLGLKPEDVESKPLIRNYLDESDNWELIFEDNASVIYIKKYDD
ncbi:MAG: hypothetical protein ABIG10_01020 [bacterium]